MILIVPLLCLCPLMTWALSRTYDVTTVAGSPGTMGSRDGTGTDASFRAPSGLSIFLNGTIIVADTSNHVLRLVSPAGVVTTIAGTLGQAGSADGAGALAQFNEPWDVAALRNGNAIIADYWNHAIRMVSQNGDVTTLAGLKGTSGAADGTGILARFNGPAGVAAASDDLYYISDHVNHGIRSVTSAGVVSTVAGVLGSPGEVDGPKSVARMRNPMGLTVHFNGAIYVVQVWHCVRKVTPNGTVTTIAGVCTSQFGGYGTADGTGANARFREPSRIAVTRDEVLYVCDYRGDGTANFYNGFGSIRRISPAGVVRTVVGIGGERGTADGSGAAVRFTSLHGIIVSGDGELIVCDLTTIRRVSIPLEFETLAGLGGSQGSQDGTGAVARFNQPAGIAALSSGAMLVCDSSNNAIRLVTLSGVVTTLAGSLTAAGYVDASGSTARFSRPYAIAVFPNDTAVVTDSRNNCLRTVTTSGTVQTFAGGTQGAMDGVGTAARFSSPAGIALDSNNDIVVADQDNCAIRKVTNAAAVVTTVVGMLAVCATTDGIGTAARFNYPDAITILPSGVIIVSESTRLRKITPDLAVSTLAGSASIYGSADGTGGSAKFSSPVAVVALSNNDLLVSDRGNHVLRQVTVDGVVTTVAGTTGVNGTTDGMADSARLNSPHGLSAVTSTGQLSIADSRNHAIRVVSLSRPGSHPRCSQGYCTTVASQPSTPQPSAQSTPSTSQPSAQATTLQPLTQSQPSTLISSQPLAPPPTPGPVASSTATPSSVGSCPKSAMKPANGPKVLTYNERVSDSVTGPLVSITPMVAVISGVVDLLVADGANFAILQKDWYGSWNNLPDPSMRDIRPGCLQTTYSAALDGAGMVIQCIDPSGCEVYYRLAFTLASTPAPSTQAPLTPAPSSPAPPNGKDPWYEGSFPNEASAYVVVIGVPVATVLISAFGLYIAYRQLKTEEKTEVKSFDAIK